MSQLHRSLLLTSMVCERGASLEQFRRIVFDDKTVRAFNGLVHLQAWSDLDYSGGFAVNFERLASALRAVEGDAFEVKVTDQFLVLKKGKLTVRVRRLPVDTSYQGAISAPAKRDRTKATGFLDALRAVAPFISDDASRPWSVSALMRGGWLYATNNLSLVRNPIEDAGEELRIPGQAVPLLLALEEIEWYAKDKTNIIIGCPDGLLSFPESSGEWPDVAAFFASRPKRLPKAAPDLHEAATTVEKFADRFVTLNDGSLKSNVETIESEYELTVSKGQGTYNARLFSLVAEHATHIDFGTYPKPVHFLAGEMQGLMTGVVPGATT
jgi:hypothetical protein